MMLEKFTSTQRSGYLILMGAGLFSFTTSCTNHTTVTKGVADSNVLSKTTRTLELTGIESLSDSLVNTYITNGEVPGMVVAVAKNGEIVFSKGYGRADMQSGAMVDTGTTFNIASVTKQFTAATIMRLVEQEKISLNDPITKYLPDYPTQGHHVTIHHLLNHTSGIHDYSPRSSERPDWFQHPLSYEEMVDLWGNKPFSFKPGEKFDYTNMGYYLLGQVIRVVTGTPWYEYGEPELLQPLGLKKTIFSDTSRAVLNQAKGYLNNEGELIDVPYRNMKVFSAGGGLSSTVSDLIRWTHLLHNGQVVSPESLAKMTTPTVLASGDTVGYGFGLYVNELGGHRKIYHGGTFGFGSYLSHYPEQGITIAILSNSTRGRVRAEELEEALARTILDIEVLDLPVLVKDIIPYEGTYAYQSTPTLVRELKVFVEDGQLMAQIGNGRPFRLRYQGNHEFIPVVNDNMRIAFSVENGQVNKLNIHEGRWEVTPARRK